MKTKHLFYTLALSAAFAACSQEEIVSQQEIAKVDLSNRPVVGNVTLDFGGMESRGTLAEDGEFNSIEFIKGEDGFGARLIDTYVPDANYRTYGDHPYRNYSIKEVDTKNYAATNYKYVNAGGNAWETDALMVEGNYLFYYPYNEANLARTANTVCLPMTQTVSAELPNQPIKDLYEGENPAIVGYAFLQAEGQDATVRPELNHIFSYPQFTFVNQFTVTEKIDGKSVKVPTEITITKVEVDYNGGFYKKGTINHEGFVNAFRNFALSQVKKANGNEVYPAVEKGNWAKGKTSLLKTAATENIVKWTKEGVGAKGKITVEFDGGLNLQPEEAFSFNMVLPAGTYNDESLKFTVYTENDKKFVNDFSVDDNEYESLNFAPGLRFPTEEYNKLNTNPVAKPSKGTLCTITLKGKLEDTVDPAAIIDDAEEFEAFLNSVADNSAWINEVENLKEAAKDKKGWSFVLADTDNDGKADMQITAEVMEMIETYLGKGGVNFTSTMQVADEETITLNKVTFENVEILSGDVTAADVYAKNVVVKNGTLTVPASYQGEGLKTITVKAGELIVDKDEFIGKNANKVVVTNTMVDGEEVAAGKLTINGEGNVFSGLTMNAGEVVIAEDADAVVGATTTDITNGKITVDGTLVVKSAYEVAASVEIELNGEVDFDATGAKIINNGLITNNSDLVAENKLGGKIVMGDVAATLVVSGNGGVVDNTLLAEVKVLGDNQTVYAEMDSAEDMNDSNFDASSSINKIVITGLWTISDKTKEIPTTVKTIEFNGGDVYVNGGGRFDISGQNVIIAADTEWNGRTTGKIITKVAIEDFKYNYLSSKGRNAKLTIGNVDVRKKGTATEKKITFNGKEYTVSKDAVFTSVDTPQGTTLKTVKVSTIDDLKVLSELAKTAGTGEGKVMTVTLLNDIDFNGMQCNLNLPMWTKFDGNDKTISNVTFAGAKAGLFGYAGGCEIENLTLKNVTVTGYQAGAFAGSAEGTKIKNCKLSGTVTVNWKKYGENYANGVGAAVGVIAGDSNIEVDAKDADIVINDKDITYANGKSKEANNLVGVVYSGTYTLN